jgi:hypothetical protein
LVDNPSYAEHDVVLDVDWEIEDFTGKLFRAMFTRIDELVIGIPFKLLCHAFEVPIDNFTRVEICDTPRTCNHRPPPLVERAEPSLLPPFPTCAYPYDLGKGVRRIIASVIVVTVVPTNFRVTTASFGPHAILQVIIAHVTFAPSVLLVGKIHREISITSKPVKVRTDDSDLRAILCPNGNNRRRRSGRSEVDAW